jgi:hypothetical protein
MDEQPPYVSIVREPDLRRIAAATRALLAEFERLRELVGHRPEILAHLYAGSAVRADDDHGREHGLVIQADEMRWSELDQLVRLAESQVDTGQHAGVGTWHQDCPDCQAVLAIARVRARHRYRTVGPTAPNRARRADPLPAAPPAGREPGRGAAGRRRDPPGTGGKPG